jgi:hypothetical protein
MIQIRIQIQEKDPLDTFEREMLRSKNVEELEICFNNLVRKDFSHICTSLSWNKFVFLA